MILSIIFGCLFGIFLGSFGFASWASVITAGIFSVILYSATFLIKESRKKMFSLLALFFLGTGLGLFRIHFSDEYRKSTLSEFSGVKTYFTGIVVDEPDVREKETLLTVLLDQASVSGKTIPLSEKILISTALYPEFQYGDKISFYAKISVPKNIVSDGGRVFDYGGYLRVREIWYTASFVYPKLVETGHGSILKQFLFSVKHHFTNAINNVLPEPESDLMGGLLIGAKQSLGKEWLAEFSRAGVSHVVVLSGYNITIVAESVIAFFSFLPGAYAFLIAGISIILFTILAGGGASAVRALIMVLVALFAKRFGREYDAGKAFGLAIVLMLLWNPLFLVFDPSFQLSVLATIGIIFVSPLLEPHLSNISEKLGLREIVSATLSTQLLVLPFLIYTTGTLSLVALPVNILILGTVPLTMFLGFVTGLFGMVSLYLSFIPAFFSYVFLWYQLAIVHFGATLSYGSFILPAFSFWIVVCIYILIFSGLYFLRKKNF